MTLRRTPKRAGLTLIGLLVVVAILGLLFAMLLPLIQVMRQRAARAQTMNNLRQMTLGTINCADTYRGKLPPAYGKYVANPNGNALPVHIWVMPFIEQDALYQQYLKGQQGLDDLVIPTYHSTADPSQTEPAKGVQNNAANLRIFSDKGMKTKYDAPMPALAGEEPCQAKYPGSIPDGVSNTIMFAARYGRCGEGGSRFASRPNTNTAAFFGQNAAKVKASPTNMTATFLLRPPSDKCRPTPLMAHAFDSYGLCVGMCDGSARNISPLVSPQTWNAAVQPNDGEVLGDDF
jgi:type II secretory pathway pseudopilin PulG